eukprot:Hpha_TRINITY_DN20124_c0_g1::TRINITY_DN20124_c0_g1_i1::g.82611::m.82611
MSIFVYVRRVRGGDVVPVKVSFDTTVRELAAAAGVREAALMFDGTTLAPGVALGDAGVSAEAVLEETDLIMQELASFVPASVSPAPAPCSSTGMRADLPPRADDATGLVMQESISFVPQRVRPREEEVSPAPPATRRRV